MKFQGRSLISYSTISIILFITNIVNCALPEWCWTRPFLDAKISTNAIGVNWALCEGQPVDLEKLAKGEFPDATGVCNEGNSDVRAKYEFAIVMYDDEMFTGQKGPYYVSINSETTLGEEFEFISGKFLAGEQEKVVKTTQQVGDISSVVIRQGDDDGNQIQLDGPFTCKRITIKQGASEWDFKCNAILDMYRKKMILENKPGSKVSFKIKQNQKQVDAGPIPIAVMLQGKKGNTAYQLLDGFEIDGKEKKYDLEFNDVGTIIALHIKSFYGRKTKPKCLFIDEVFVTVTPPEGDPQGPVDLVFKNIKHLKICKSTPSFAISIDGERPKNTPKAFPEMDPGQQMTEEDVSPDPQMPEPVTNFQNGLLPHEEKRIKRVGCETPGNQVLEDIHYFSDAGNYEVQYVICSPGCNTDYSIIGRSVYHPDTTVCAAGIIDGSIPKSGGLMGVIRLSGQNKYEKTTKSYGMTVAQGGASSWSFTTVKVNNPDFSKSDLRILDHNGEPSYEGRVEFRVTGSWGSVSNEGTSQAFARQVCLVLNYKDGVVLNSKRGFCADHKGQNYCGFDGQPVHYSNYDCAETAESILDCTRHVPGSFDHEEDVIVKCSMIDSQKLTDIEPDEGTIRLLGPKGSPSTDGKGRIEIFKQRKWGSICSEGFVTKSADVACKQMGYDSGKTLGNPGSFKACEYLDQNFCVKDTSEIKTTNVECTDQEKLGDCGGQETDRCSIEMTAVIECEGERGDSSGQSQQDTADEIPPNPDLGQLPLANPYFLNCKTTINDYMFQGDPGSIYVSFCPAGCHNDVSVIHGSGIYDEQSPICKAAIHNGTLDNRGGFVSVKMGWSHKGFKSSLMFGVQSLKWGWAGKTFFVTKTINWHKKLSLDTYAAPFLGLKTVYEKPLVNNLSKIVDPTSFLKMQEHFEKGTNEFTQKFQSYLNKKSFLKMKEEEEHPTFLWASPIDFKFNKNNPIPTKGLEKNEDLKNLESFTIFTQFKVEKMHSEDGQILNAMIVGHSDQSCWQLAVNSQGTAFGKLDEMFPLGYAVGLNKWIHMAVVYNKVEKTLKSYYKSDFTRKEEQVEDVTFDFVCNGIVNIGKNGSQDTEIFDGEISYVKIFTFPYEDDKVWEMFERPIPLPIKPKDPQSCGGSDVLKSTIDQRKCVSPCSRDILPPSPDAPHPPAEAQIAQSPTGPGSDSSISQTEIDNNDIPGVPTPGSEGGDETVNNGPSNSSMNLECTDTIFTKGIKGEIGKTYRFYCDQGCTKDDGFLFGTQVYEEQTAICLAAIHDGKIKQDKGGEFLLIISQAPHTFYASNANGLESTTIEVDKSKPVQAFTLEPAPEVVDVNCEQDASDVKLWGGQLEGMKAFNCPKYCSKVQQKVFNNRKEYWYKSSVCQAAIHSGILTDLGGTVKLIFQPPIKVYESSYNAGINGTPYVNAQLTGKSFVISGSKLETTNYFVVDYDKSRFEEIYKIVESAQNTNGPSNWEIVSFPYENHRHVYVNNSDIEDKQQKPEFASMLLRKDFESQNGLLKINIYYDNLRTKTQGVGAQCGIFFRYYDKSNYYVLKFNIPDRSSIELFKKVNGEEHLLSNFDNLESKGDALIFDIWYRYYIVFQQNNIKVFRQGLIRNLELIFDIEDDKVGRGKVGLATNGDARSLYWDGFSVQDYNPTFGIIPEKDLEHRQYSKCQVPTSLAKREKFYMENYHTEDKGGMYIFYFRHNVLFSFCAGCCANYVEAWEKILFWECQRGCIEVNRAHEKTLREQQGIQIPIPWIPKKKMWVDALFEGSDEWYQSEVIDVIWDDDDIQKGVIKVEVQFIKNIPQEFTFPWPTEHLKKCGTNTDFKKCKF